MKKWLFLFLFGVVAATMIFSEYLLGSSSLLAGSYRIRDEPLNAVIAAEVWTGDPKSGVGRFRENAKIVNAAGEWQILVPNAYQGSFKETRIFGYVVFRSESGPFLKIITSNGAHCVSLDRLVLVASSSHVTPVPSAGSPAQMVNDVVPSDIQNLALKVQDLRSQGKTKEQISVQLGITIQQVETIFKELGP